MALPELNSISVAAELSPPDVTELTTGSVDGTGIYDTLMRSSKAHLMEEWNANRISNAEYSAVYLGMMQATLQQSVAFLLNHQQKEKVSAEIGLIRQQTVTELTQTDDDIPLGLGFNGGTAVEGLVKSQKDLQAQQILTATAEVALAQERIEIAQTEKALTGQKIVTELAQTDDTISPEAMAFGLNGSTVIEGMIALQKSKTTSEISFTDEKIITEASVREKTDAEVTLLAQKAITELAQTSDAVVLGTPALNTTTAVGGLTATQKDLFIAQTEGFARDAEQKAAKMLLDTWSVRATTDGALASVTNKLDDASIGAVVTKLKAGIGV